MSLMPKVIFTTLVVLMISSGMVILPAYALPSFLTVPAHLAAPTGLKATVISPHSIQLIWDAVPTATSYNIYRSTIHSSGFAKIGTSTTTSYLDQAGIGSDPHVKTYYYEVNTYSSKLGGGYASPAAYADMLSSTPTGTTPTTQPTGTTPPVTTPTTPPTVSPNPACQAVKTILTNSGYSVTVIAKVMADMNCS